MRKLATILLCAVTFIAMEWLIDTVARAVNISVRITWDHSDPVGLTYPVYVCRGECVEGDTWLVEYDRDGNRVQLTPCAAGERCVQTYPSTAQLDEVWSFRLTGVIGNVGSGWTELLCNQRQGNWNPSVDGGACETDMSNIVISRWAEAPTTTTLVGPTTTLVPTTTTLMPVSIFPPRLHESLFTAE